MIKFIHCADLHLDSPFKSKSHLSSKIFEDVQKVHMKVSKIVDIALKKKLISFLLQGFV